MTLQPRERGRRGPWLSLGEASRILGITPGTLRRWADQGQVSAFTTPGGHRRFALAAIEALLPAARPRRPRVGVGGAPDRIVRAYRRARAGRPAWLATLSEADLAGFRDRGRRLAALLVGYLDALDSDDAMANLANAEREAEEQGRQVAVLGISLSEAVEGFLQFRSPFVGELAGMARRRRLDTREATALMVEAEAAMDRLLVAFMSGHAR
jgi:excisionase family DNA binding protein